ncbi:MAG TPA: hypothetical protein PKC08_01085 [Pseudomonadales bacterium]|nr:hypothetical protein [Pseudomonadales bacterium]
MRSIFRFLAALLLVALSVILAFVGLLFSVLDRKPLVQRDATVSTEAIGQARQLLAGNDPRRLHAGEERTAHIPASLLDEGFNYVATQVLHARAAFGLVPEAAELRLSLPLPFAPVFLNLQLQVPAAAGQPHLSAARLGKLALPPAAAEAVLDVGIAAAGYDSEWRLLQRAVRGLAFDPGAGVVELRYAWNPDLLDSAREVALLPADVARIRAANDRYVDLLEGRTAGSRLDLAVVLGPMLGAGNVSAEQRRAALLVLASSLAGQSLSALVPEAAGWRKVPHVVLVLRGRHDSAQHFVVSAALAAWAGEPVATAIGVYKELEDARHGSGFSFADLAADRAGTRLGELVRTDPARIVEVLGNSPRDADLLPALDGLPEFLPDAEFRRRYGGPGEPAYERLAAEIERRLAGLRLYR